MRVWTRGVDSLGFCSTFRLVYCCEGCSEGPFSWQVLQKYVISSQSAHASGLTRTPWDYFGVHHQCSGQTPADNPCMWPRCMLWTSPEQFGTRVAMLLFPWSAVCVTVASTGMSKCLLFFFTLQRLWHVAFAAHAPSQNSIYIISCFLMHLDVCLSGSVEGETAV